MKTFAFIVMLFSGMLFMASVLFAVLSMGMIDAKVDHHTIKILFFISNTLCFIVSATLFICSGGE